ncbi:MAG TPA: ROK family protein [Candidatus Limnocylindrales bacterium]
MSARGLLAGIDVGGSKIAVLVADRDLAICSRATTPISVDEADGAVDRISSALDQALEAGGLAIGDLGAMGIGVPGRVDTDSGTVSLAVNLAWHDLPLGELLQHRYRIPVRVENDVRAAAAGLHERRVLGDEADLAYLSVGTGISAGVVLDGRLHRGARGMAGEIGHVVVDRDGPRCPCGLAGCLEAVASGPAVARRAEAAVVDGAASSLRGRRPITAVEVYAAAAAGDELALGIAEDAGTHLARAVHELVMAYDVPRVVLGGGVALAGRTFLDPILRGLDRLRAESELARDVLPPDVVQILPDGSDAGAWGAVVLARGGLGREVAHP